MLTPDPPGAPPLESAGSAGPVPPPTTLRAATSGQTVTLDWTASPFAEAYWLEVGTSQGLDNAFRGFVPGTRLTAPGPIASFWARLRAWSIHGYSALSNEVMFTVGAAPCQAPATPTGFVATVSGTTLSLRWTASPGARSYHLQAGTSSGSSNAFDGDVGGGTALTFNVGGVPPGTYYLRLRGRNVCGTSAPTLDVSIVIGAPGPPPPTPGSGYGVRTNAALPGFNTALHGNRLTPQDCMRLCDQHDGTGGRFLCKSFDYQKGPLDASGNSPGWCFLSDSSHENGALRRNDPDWDYYWNRARVFTQPPP